MLHVRDAGRRTEPSPVLKLALTFLVFYLVVPGLTGQNAQAAAQTPAYQGYHDVSNCDVVYGWAWDANQPNAAINVDVYADNNLVATGTANQNRPDVAAAGFGTGYYGFSIPTPATLKDGQPHTISVRFAGTTTDLSTTPRQILCTPPQIVSYPDAKRLIEQSTFGPSPALIAHVRQVGFEAFLDEQFSHPASSYPTMQLYPTTRDTATCPDNSTCSRDNYSMYLVQNRFFTNALYGPDQLRQRVAFALHQIFVVSSTDIFMPAWMTPYLQTLDRNAFGNYRQLLHEITLNPAMGNYLDMAGNTRTNPNENYAREVLQLFSIGTVRLNVDGTPQLDEGGQPIPAYTQDTINNFARVFTGWNRAAAPGPGISNYIDPMIANQSQHDTGAKTLLRGQVIPGGQTARQDLDAALDNIFNDPNVGPFIGRQLIQHLVTSNPSPAYVGRVAAVFNDNGFGVRGDLKAVVQAILLDEDARGDLKTGTNYGRLRHPLQLITNLLRAFNPRSADGSGLSDGYLNPQSSSMGMDLFRPPSVFSYFSPSTVVRGTAGVRGPEFGILTTSTALRRANFVNTMVFSRINTGANTPLGTSIDLTPLQAQAANPTQLVDSLNELLMHNSMSAEMRNSIIGAVTAVPASNPLKRARTAVYLVATSSQYQVER